jgi:hypothetical protein
MSYLCRFHLDVYIFDEKAINCIIVLISSKIFACHISPPKPFSAFALDINCTDTIPIYEISILLYPDLLESVLMHGSFLGECRFMRSLLNLNVEGVHQSALPFDLGTSAIRLAVAFHPPKRARYCDIAYPCWQHLVC